MLTWRCLLTYVFKCIIAYVSHRVNNSFILEHTCALKKSFENQRKKRTKFSAHDTNLMSFFPCFWILRPRDEITPSVINREASSVSASACMEANGEKLLTCQTRFSIDLSPNVTSFFYQSSLVILAICRHRVCKLERQCFSKMVYVRQYFQHDGGAQKFLIHRPLSLNVSSA